MDVHLLSIRHLPKSKSKFAIHLRIDGVACRTSAVVHPKLEDSIDLPDDQTTALLLQGGRKLRTLCSLILQTYRGEKLHFPIALQEPLPLRKRPALTIKPTRKPLQLTHPA